MSNEPLPISREMMSDFVAKNRDVLLPIWEWIFAHAETGDSESIDIFLEWILRTLKQASQLMHQDLEMTKGGTFH